MLELASDRGYGRGSTRTRSEYSKSAYFKSHERYYSSPFHVYTGCREGRLAGFAVMQAVLLPFGATSELKTQEKRKKCERNRIGRSNYLVVKWPKCSVFPVLTEGKELRAYEYNKLN